MIAVESESLVDLVEHAQRVGAQQIVTPYIPQGPLNDALTEISAGLSGLGIPVVPLRRQWDSLIWPHATAGFFKVRQQIPSILRKLGLDIVRG